MHSGIHMTTPKIILYGLEGEALKLRAQGLSQSEIARRLSEQCGAPISQPHVSRFFSNYAPIIMKERGLLKEGIIASENKVEQLKQINQQLLEDLRNLRDNGDMKTASSYYNQLHKNIELQAKLLGDMAPDININIINNPRIMQLTQIILEEVDEATRQRIIAKLEAIDGGADGSK